MLWQAANTASHFPPSGHRCFRAAGLEKVAVRKCSGKLHPVKNLMFNGQFFFGRRRFRPSSETRAQREKRFIWLAILFGIILAVVFGLVLYSMNMHRRI